jgi:hypothetical protein
MTTEPRELEATIEINIDQPTTEFHLSGNPNIEIDLEPQMVADKNPAQAPSPAPALPPKTDDEKSFAAHKSLIKCFKQRLGPTISIVQDFHAGMFPKTFCELPDSDIKSMA